MIYIMISSKTQQMPLASCDMILGLREASKELGISVEADMKLFGIEPNLLNDPQGYIPTIAFADFLTHVAEKYHCPDLGLHIAKHRPKTSFGILTHLILACPDVGTALRKGHKHIKLISESTIWELSTKSGFAQVTRKDRYPFGKDLTQMHMLSIAQYYELLTALMGSEWHPSAVHFVHKAPEDDRAYRQLFKSPVYFEQTFNGLIFPEHYLQTPIPNHDPALLKKIEYHIRELERRKYADNLCIDTRNFIHKTLGTSNCTLRSAATYLGVHPKALQRELKANDLTFKMILAEARQEIAEYYLEHSDMSLIQLSALLGYSCPTAFSRAFKKQNKVSPKQWRTQHYPPANAL